MRRGVDIAYWLFNPLVTKWVTRVVLFVALFGLARPSHPHPTLALLLLADFIGYWTHRAFHHRWLWRFHAIHHSSTTVDWLSAARVHPVNEIVTRLVQAVPLYLLGFRSPALVPLLTAYAIFLHMDVRWTFGPLRYVIATPHFHRWHHAAEGNYAGLFPVWDLVFGSWVFPPTPPTRFGVTDEVPPTFLAQLAWPFTRK